MESSMFRDLAKLAQERVRRAVTSVAQLVEEDEARAALLVGIAADMLDGAASILEDSDDELSEHDAFEKVFQLLIANVGYDRVLAAIGERSKAGEMKR